ncbi:MAG: hypothetical protein Q8R35_03545 [bacterium]|nr:hypothetical protein [bacterium]
MTTRIHRRIPERYVTQRNFKLAVGGAAIAIVIGFFAYEFKFLRAPSLELFSPAEDMVADTDAFDVRGASHDPDADLTLNGRPLYSGETGEFSERIYLVKGVNRLDFEAKNRYGKTTTITRYIVLR